MPAGQVLTVVACSPTVPIGGAVLVSSSFQDACPAGQSLYVVPGYIPFSESASYLDGLMGPLDSSVAGGLFGFGFGVVVFFYLLGLKGSVLIKPFWSGWR